MAKPSSNGEFFNLIISRQFGKTYSRPPWKALTLAFALAPASFSPSSEKAVLFSIIFQDKKTPSPSLLLFLLVQTLQ